MSSPSAPAPLPDAGPAAALPPAPEAGPEIEPQPGPALAELGELYRRHQARLLQAAYRVLGNRSDAEDALQTVFLRLARGGAQLELRPGAELGGYLHRMVINAAIDLLRRRRPQAGPEAETRLASAAPSPERAHRAQELQDVLRAAVAQLGGRAGEIFALRYWEEWSNTEIARRLGIPRVSVAVTLHRARRQLQESLRRHWGEQL